MNEKALELIQLYMESKTMKVPKLDANKARFEYQMQYEGKKDLQRAVGEKSMVTSSLTCNGSDIYASTNPLASLKRVGIKDLRLHVPCKGAYLLMRTLEPPILTVGIMVFVEDHLGNVIIVSLYNLIDYDSVSYVPVEDFLPVGTVFILKEPFLKLAQSGQIVVRSDCPSDFIRINRVHFMFDSVHKMQWKNKIDTKYIRKTSPKTVVEWKVEGNALYNKKNYLEALECYLTGLKLCTDSSMTVTLELNISASYLALECFESALEHASNVLISEPNNVKALYRAARSHYMLRQFTDAKRLYERLLTVDPQHKSASVDLKQNILRLKEQGGDINIYKLYITSLVKPNTPIDCADYMGPVEVTRLVTSKGRSIVATENILPGTLLMLSKAFQAAFDGSGPENQIATIQINNDFTMDHGSKVKLLAQTCQSLLKNPNTFGKLVYSLASNDPEMDKSFQIFCDEQKKGEPIADAGRLKKILTHNCFCLMQCKDQDECFVKSLFNGSGLFIYPSYFNHSCLPNATWHIYNDVIVIRATKFINKGDEVTIPYSSGRSDFLEKEKNFEMRGFQCSCVLCRLDRSEPKHIHTKRADLVERHQKLCNEHYNSLLINPGTRVMKEMNKLIKGLEMTYHQRELLTVRLFDPYMRVAQGLVVKAGEEFVVKVTAVVDKALSCLGLSCDMLLRCTKDHTFSFPENALICEKSITEAVVFLIFRFDISNQESHARKWVKVLLRMEQIFTGGSIHMVKAKYKDDSVTNIYSLLKSEE